MTVLPKDLKVAVLMGGPGSEREVSLESGRNISRALHEADITAIPADITPEHMEILKDKSIDVFFLALHGTFGEDGQLQAILEKQRRVYTGSDARASRLAIDKVASKQHFARAGVPVAKDWVVHKAEELSSLSKALKGHGKKFVVKPVTEGSSVGVQIVKGADNVVKAAAKCLRDFGSVMVEPFLKGREITVGIVDREVLPIVEVRSRTGFYDYHAKYIDDATEYLFDTVTDAAVIEKCNQAAMACYDCLGCRHISRVDFILTEDNEPYVLEINTLPGFTSHSLVPKAAEHARISQSEVCVRILEAALRDAKKVVCG